MISMPKPPDAGQVASTQFGYNTLGSEASSIIGNANEVTPYGTVNYTTSGYETLTDPATGRQYQVPRYNRTTTLAPEQQGLLNLQNQASNNLGQTAVQQSDMLRGLLQKPLGTEGLQPWQTLPQWNEDAFSKDRGRVEQALMSRWSDINNPQFAQRESQLAARGLTPGAEGYDYAAGEMGRARNDATMQAIMAGGQEQSRLLGEEAKRADFGNQLRGAQFGERQTLQAFPVNLITALMSGSQVNVPQAAPYRSTSIEAPNYSADVWNNYNARAQNAMAQNQGLFGLGANLVKLPFMMA